MAGKPASTYDDLIMDHIRSARNYCVPECVDASATGTNPLCGDEMTVYIRRDGGRIADIAYQCTCCGISMASGSMMTEMVKGVSVEEAQSLAREMLALLGSPGAAANDISAERRALVDTLRRFPTRGTCASLPWTTLQRALRACDEHVS